MKKHLIAIFTACVLLTGVCQKSAAQFPIKIPKIKKPEPTKPVDTSTTENRTNSNQTGGRKNYVEMPRIEPATKPVLLRDTLEIRIQSENHYWKFPNDNYYTSWIPRVGFETFVEYGSRVRYKVEWFNADGTPWFSEFFDSTDRTNYATTIFSSEHSGEDANKLFAGKAVTTTGTYGLKISDAGSGETVFQGKFKVGKIAQSDAGDTRRKNLFMFYVDNDWLMPVGYVGFTYSGLTSWEKSDPQPIVFLWFKGEPDAARFEAKLFYNNQQIATTDDDGYVNYTEYARGENCYAARDVCSYKLWAFAWKNFVVEDSDAARGNHPNGIFTRDKPGEYTVKVFYKGEQVRETKFTIDQKGWIAPNQFSNQIYLTNYKILVPVKVSGTLDKWNAAAWKTDFFYGNPLSGFAAP